MKAIIDDKIVPDSIAYTDTFSSYNLKECEWRFNTPQPKKQQTQLIQWAKEYLQ